ncbi:MAG TPA: hypothetical protein VE032_03045 [Actinomycetota bacterium]|nr:hypothetical protein [Actinomycetota bacterium]
MDTPGHMERAETQYNDYIGTCAFDGPHPDSIEDLFGLPDGQYHVVAFHVGGGSSLEGMGVATAYVVPQGPDGTPQDDDEVEVVQIHAAVSMEDVLRGLQRTSITATANGWRGRRLRIGRVIDIPGGDTP